MNDPAHHAHASIARDRSAVPRLVLAVAAFVVAGALSAVGPYAGIRARMAPRAPLEERPATTDADMRAVLDRLGPDGRAAYRRQLAADLLVVAANATWVGLWLSAVGRRTLPGAAAGVVAPTLAVLPAIADLTENAALALAIGAHPAPGAGLIGVAAVATRAKLALFAVAIVAGVALSAVLVARRFTRATAPGPG